MGEFSLLKYIYAYVGISTSAWWRGAYDGHRHSSSTWFMHTFQTALLRGNIS